MHDRTTDRRAGCYRSASGSNQMPASLKCAMTSLQYDLTPCNLCSHSLRPGCNQKLFHDHFSTSRFQVSYLHLIPQPGDQLYLDFCSFPQSLQTFRDINLLRQSSIRPTFFRVHYSLFVLPNVSYSGCPGLKSRSGDPLSCLRVFVSFFSLSRKMLG